MKKIVFLFAFLSFVAYSGPALAQSVAGEEDGLDIGTSGILPTNPFYFLKEWRRDFRRLITRNPVRRAELELDIVNQRAAEINQLQELTPENTEAIARAIQQYEENIAKLTGHLRELSETSANPNVDRLLEELTRRTLKHEQLFEELRIKFEEDAPLNASFERAQGAITEAISEIPGRIETPEKFRERLLRVREGDLPMTFMEFFATSTVIATSTATSSPELSPSLESSEKKEEVKKVVVPAKKEPAPKPVVVPPTTISAPTVTPPPPPAVPVKELTVRVDDQGLHPAWLTVKKGERVRLTFMIDINSTDYAGYVFKTEPGFGWGGTTGRIFPNHQETVEFIADKSFEFTSQVYSGAARGRGSVTVEE